MVKCLSKDYTAKNQRWFDLFYNNNNFICADEVYYSPFRNSDKDMRLLVIRDKELNINNAIPFPIFLGKMDMSCLEFFKNYNSIKEISRSTYKLFQQYNIDINTCLYGKPIYELNSYHYNVVQDNITIYPQLLKNMKIGDEIIPYCSGYIPSDWSCEALKIIKRYDRPNYNIWILTEITKYANEKGYDLEPITELKWLKLNRIERRN